MKNWKNKEHVINLIVTVQIKNYIYIGIFY